MLAMTGAIDCSSQAVERIVPIQVFYAYCAFQLQPPNPYPGPQMPKHPCTRSARGPRSGSVTTQSIGGGGGGPLSTMHVAPFDVTVKVYALQLPSESPLGLTVASTEPVPSALGANGLLFEYEMVQFLVPERWLT